MVADNESGKSIESEVRTSSGMFLRKRQVSKFLFIYLFFDFIWDIRASFVIVFMCYKVEMVF